MSALESLDWGLVRQQYDLREQVRKEIQKLRDGGRTVQLVDLLLGITDAGGNYSAAHCGRVFCVHGGDTVHGLLVRLIERAAARYVLDQPGV